MVEWKRQSEIELRWAMRADSTVIILRIALYSDAVEKSVFVLKLTWRSVSTRQFRTLWNRIRTHRNRTKTLCARGNIRDFSPLGGECWLELSFYARWFWLKYPNCRYFMQFIINVYWFILLWNMFIMMMIIIIIKILSFKFGPNAGKHCLGQNEVCLQPILNLICLWIRSAVAQNCKK